MICTLLIIKLTMLTHIFIAELAKMIRFHVDNRILRGLLIKILSCPRKSGNDYRDWRGVSVLLEAEIANLSPRGLSSCK